ncbi:t-SNARE [Aspergillus varians]
MSQYGQSYSNAYPAYGEPQPNPYGGNQGYSRPYDQDLEMEAVQQPQPADPNMLLNEIQKVKEGIQTIRSLREDRLAAAHNAFLASESLKEDETARATLELTQKSIVDGYYKLKNDIERIKKTPGSANVQPQLEVQGRAIRNEFEQYQKDQSLFQRRLTEQVRRRVKIASPELTEEEAHQQADAVISGELQTFQVTGSRMTKAKDVQEAVQGRSRAIQKILKDIETISSLVNQTGDFIQQQAPAVEQIDQGAENVARDLGNANTQLGQAVESARKARKWKWYALLIVIIIIAIIVAVAVGVTQSK